MIGFIIITNVSDLRAFLVALLEATRHPHKGFKICVCRKLDNEDDTYYLTSPNTCKKIPVAAPNFDITFMLDWDYMKSVLEELSKIGLSVFTDSLPVSIQILDSTISIELKYTFPIGEVQYIDMPDENYQKKGRIVRQGNKPL